MREIPAERPQINLRKRRWNILSDNNRILQEGMSKAMQQALPRQAQQSGLFHA
jgi:hypothetical protein